MDSDEVADDRPRRRRRRRRRRRTRDDAESPALSLAIGPLLRQLAGLGVYGLFFLLVVAAPILNGREFAIGLGHRW